MLKVVETFSGIGSQAKALKNIGIEYEIICTADWDINAIIAYDLIHHGNQDLSVYKNMTKQDLIKSLSKYTLSLDGKKPATEKNMQDLNEEVLKRVLYAIKRSNNLVSITDIKARDLPNKIDSILQAIKTVTDWALRVGIALAGVSLVIAFVLYAVADVDRKQQVKQRIIQTMFGIVGIILAISLVNLIIGLF